MPQKLRAEFSTRRISEAAASDFRRRLSRVSRVAIISLFAATSLCIYRVKAAHSAEFNIPSQSLNVALSRYGDATGREALYDASLTAGMRSGDVVGIFSSDEALRQLLSPTGLIFEFVDERRFVLLPAPETHRRANQKSRSPQHWRYYGLIQLGVLGSLCNSRHVRPGRYRIVVMFWIAPDGAVAKIRRIGSTGDAEGDQQLDAALSSVRVGESPPADFVSPILMLIVPETSGMTVCNSANATPGPLGIGR